MQTKFLKITSCKMKLGLRVEVLSRTGLRFAITEYFSADISFVPNKHNLTLVLAIRGSKNVVVYILLQAFQHVKDILHKKSNMFWCFSGTILCFKRYHTSSRLILCRSLIKLQTNLYQMSEMNFDTAIAWGRPPAWVDKGLFWGYC